MKRYEFETGYTDGEYAFRKELKDGDYIKFEDHQAVRRRLLAKLCWNRWLALGNEMKCGGGEKTWCRRCKTRRSRLAWLGRAADALKCDQPLTYFRRLGEDK